MLEEVFLISAPERTFFAAVQPGF